MAELFVNSGPITNALELMLSSAHFGIPRIKTWFERRGHLNQILGLEPAKVFNMETIAT